MNKQETLLMPILFSETTTKLSHNCNYKNDFKNDISGIFKMDTLLDNSLPQKEIILKLIDSCENMGIKFDFNVINEDITDEKNNELEKLIENKQIKIEDVPILIDKLKKEKEEIEKKKMTIELIFNKDKIKYIKRNDYEKICEIMKHSKNIITDIGRLGIVGLQYGKLVIYLGKNEKYFEKSLKEDHNVIRLCSDYKDIKNIVKMIKENKIDRRFRRIISNGEALGEKFNWIELAMNIIRMIKNAEKSPQYND
jgi:hypothetical protein